MDETKIKDNELSEEFLNQLTEHEREFILSWKKLYESEDFQKKIKILKDNANNQ